MTTYGGHVTISDKGFATTPLNFIPNERTAPGLPAGVDSLPLSSAQRGIWFAQHVAGDLPISVAQYVEIEGALDTALLEVACRTTGREFGSGNLHLVEIDGEPRQYVDDERGAPVYIVDLRGMDDPMATAHRLMLEDYSRPLDLLVDDLMVSIIYQVGVDHHLWYLRAHHIALDGFAAITMVRRITELYNAGIRGEVAPPSKADELAEIIAQDSSYPGSARYENDRQYWSDHLADAPPVVSLAGRLGKPTLHPALVSTPIPADTARLLDDAAHEGGGVTPVIVAAFAAYLARMTGSAEVLLSLPVSGRHSAVLRRSGGMIANVVPLRVPVAGCTLDEVIARVKGELMSALRRQRYRQEDIFADMGIARDETASFGPAVNLMMVDSEVVLGDVTGRLHVLTSGPTSDLFVNIYPGAGKDSTHIDFQGNPNIYTPAELAGHHRRFLMFLHEFLSGPSDRHVGRLALLDEQERSALLPVRGGAATAPRLLPDILADTVRRHADAIAISSEIGTLTYRELDAASARLARRLIAEGCGPETAVAIVLRRSALSVTAAWAVARSGATIVHVDPAQPLQRIEHILADSGADVAVTVDEYTDRLPGSTRPVIVDDDTVGSDGTVTGEGTPIGDADRIRPVRPGNVAYMTYTSGSTGVPKGVQVTHGGLADLIADRTDAYRLDHTARVSYALSPSFDASIEQLLTCFANGAALVIVPPEVIGGEQLTRLLADEHITHLTLTPTMLATVEPEALTDLRTVVVGGDRCAQHIVGRWTRCATMINEYGPTEATITASSSVIDPSADLTAGSPVRGASVMVLDPMLAPVPVGTVGEVYLAGPGLARGYAHMSASTAARFVAHPHGAPGERMYRTGDLARWVGDASQVSLELLGRTDFQLKIRGYRIEPGEIDTALTGHAGVEASITVPVRNNIGATVLASYVVPVGDARVEPAELERFARECLPPHMVPAVITMMDDLPVNAFGKVDRRALPDPVFASAASGRMPSTPRETELAQLFSEVLGVPRVGADDSFFTLGGDSILSIQLVARAKASGLAFSTQDVFEHKTVAALAAVATDLTDDAGLPELPGGGVGSIPLSPIMHAMLDRGPVDRFTQAALVELPDGLTRPDLVRALQALVDHHDILRARLVDGQPGETHIEVGAPGTVDAAQVLDLVWLDRRDADEIDHHLQVAADTLDPRAGAMIRFVWMSEADDTQPDLMWLVIHHLAVDGVSWRILLTGLAQAWQQIAGGADPALGDPTTSVRRWVHGLLEHSSERTAAELDRWTAVLEPGERLLGDRGLDPDRDVLATAGCVRMRMPAEVTEAVLTTVPARFHGGANDALLAALVLALARWRRRHGVTGTGIDELIALEGHGREEAAVPGADLTGTVGWFTSRFPVRLDLDGVDVDDAFAGGAAAGQAIRQVKEQLRAVPDNGIGFGMVRYLDPVGRAELGGRAEPQISFNYLGRAGTGDHAGPWAPSGEFDSLVGTGAPQMALPAVLDINAIAAPGPDGLELDATWEFASLVLHHDDVEELAGLWAQALEALARHVRADDAGGHTPSDFGLVATSQTEIDGWTREYPSLTDVWPLTALQSGLLFHALYDDALEASDHIAREDGYTVQAELTLGGSLHPDRMRRAAQRLVDRHDSLRVAFVETGTGPRQLVLRDVEVDWTDSDVTGIDDPGERERQLRRLVAESAAPFDLAHPPLLRFHLIRVARGADRDADRYLLVLTNHHIVLDGWSAPLLIHELLLHYIADGEPAELPQPRSFRDYLLWLHSRDHDAARTAWQEMLAEIESPTRLTGAAGTTAGGDIGETEIVLDPATTDAILGLGRTHEVTANTSIQVAWALVLSAMTGRTDVVFGNTVSDRPAHIPGIERMVGLFINTLPVRVRLDPAESIVELLARTQTEQAALLDHRHVGLAELQRTTGVADMFDTVTVLESYPVDTDAVGQTLADAGLRWVDLVAHDATPYPVSLQVTPPRPGTAGAGSRGGSADETPGGYVLTVRYAVDRIDAEAAGALLDRFVGLLRQIATDPGRKVGAVTSCGHGEHAELSAAGTTGESGASQQPVRLLRDILADSARRHPDAVAVRADGTTLTYRELAHRADRVAAELIRRGAGPESFVALAVPRSADLVVAIWAVARTGAAFVALDPGNPAHRLAELISDAGCTLGVTRAAVTPNLPAGVDWLVLDAPAGRAGTGSAGTGPDDAVTAAIAADGLRPDNAAYLIFTSGSTGKPKAVLISHRGLADRVAAQAHSFGVRPGSTVLQVASPGFDACVSEVLLALGNGGGLVVAPPEVYGGTDLEELARAEHISHAIITPSALNTMDPTRLASTATIAVVGEATGADIVNRWSPGRRLMNHYGPTEATIWATGADDLAPGRPVTIGRPIQGVSVSVLDAWLRPVPVGVAGELYLGGPGLARGYHARPGITAARFVADPRSATGERIYRTGDSVRWVRGRDGLELDYLGRNDQQVKIRGLRIETGDIDAHLGRHREVAQVATVVQPGPAGQPVLVSYVVGAPGQTLDVGALHDGLADTLPQYMSPAAIVELESMPLTRTGKIDRKALPPWDFRSEEEGGRTPSTPAEVVFAHLFAEVLRLDQVTADSNFFTLGGDSIVSMQLVALAKAAGFAITPRDVFEAKTVAAIAELAALRSADDAPVPDAPVSASDPRFADIDHTDLEALRHRYPTLSEVWPLSPTQAGIHFHSSLDPDARDNYTVQSTIALSGDVDGARLRRAAQALVDRHDILRAGFAETSRGPRQIVVADAEVAFREIDLVGDVPTESAERVVAESAAAAFDLSVPSLIRFTLVRRDVGSFVLHITNHHVILDGWSMPLLMRELLEYYGDPERIAVAGPAPSYRDHLVWLAGQDHEGSTTAWAQAYADVEAPTRVSRGGAAMADAAVGEVVVELPSEEFGRLRSVTADSAVTIGTALSTAWSLVLRVLTGETDVILGSAVAGRPAALPGAEQALGMFLNTVPVRARLEPALSLQELLIQVQEGNARLLDHHYVGLPAIHRAAGVSDLFDTALAFQSFPLHAAALQQLVDSAGLRVDGISGIDATPYPLSVVVAPNLDARNRTEEPTSDGADDGRQGGAALTITLRYRRDEFDAVQAREIIDRFVEYLTCIAAEPQTRLGMLTQDVAGVQWPRTATCDAAVPVSTTLGEILTASARRSPDEIAVRSGGTGMSYRELDEQSNRLARHLLRHAQRPQGVVACVLPRSPQAVVAIWAAAKAGVPFLPIDPGLPAERIGFLLTDCAVTLGFTLAQVRDGLPGGVDWLVLDDQHAVDRLAAESAAPITDAERGGPIRLADTAYVIYTSGSTGTPKGVRVSHRGLAHLVAAQRRVLDVGPAARVLQVASPGFDASVFELLMAHGSGGRLVVSPADVYGGPELAELIRCEAVTHAVLTPSALATVPTDPEDDEADAHRTGPATLRVLATAGESVGPQLIDRWAPGRIMVNLYGPTESTIWATASEPLHPGGPVTIGTAVGPVGVTVLDTWMRPVPQGIAGELYLVGPGLADGYIGRPGTTATRFVPCPFGDPGDRMYRTGDIVRRNADHQLEFLGRNDFQVKVRGTRVEVGEIDALLGERDDVDYAVTVGRSRAGAGAGHMLVSYVVAAPGTTLSSTRLRAALAEKLPAYMVPAAVVVLDEIPMTRTGKLDRAGLPEPVFAASEFRAPANPMETAVAAAFEHVLDVPRVGADDDFFALGGDSLSASVVVARLGEVVGTRVPVRAVFDAPTVGALAVLVGSLDGGGRIPLTAGPRPELVPLSPAQQRMWFLNRMEPESAAYNIPVILRLSGRLDVAALRDALSDVTARHEVLRTIYPDTAGEPRQQILDRAPIEVDVQTVAAAAVADTVGEFVRRGFDVTAHVPMRVALFEIVDGEASGRVAEGAADRTAEFLLVLVVHHIAGDGQSMVPLSRDVMTAYATRRDGRAPGWEPLSVQYADYALWQREVLGAAEDAQSLMRAQLDFWRSSLAGAPDVLDLPTDRPRPAVATFAGGSVPVEIGPELHSRLLTLARSRGASLFLVLHAALATVLARLSGGDDIVVGTPVAGRGEPGLDDLVGMFVNTLALRTAVTGDESFAELLDRVRDADLQAFEHADVPFERIVEELNPERSTAHHPLFGVALALQNLSKVHVELPEVTVSRAQADTGICQFDLQLVIADEYGTDANGKPVVAQGISGSMMFARDLFDAATVAGFVRRLQRVLEAVVDDATTPIGDIDWLDTDERTMLLSQVGARTATSPTLLPEVFAAAVERNPDGAAVISGETVLSYTELDRRSNRLARHLIGLGAAPERPVAVAIERSAESVVAWWAVVKTGAPYVPVDPHYPSTRIEQMVSDSGAVLGITTSAARVALPDTLDWIMPADADVATRIDGLPATPIGQDECEHPVRATNTAWVVFTSGSTGVPKGVAVSHAGIADYLSTLHVDAEIGATSRVLHFASPSFDASLLEILLAVSASSALVVAPTGMRGGDELADLLRAQRVTHAFVTPAALASVEPDGLEHLRVVMSGGDEVPTDLVTRWLEADSARARQFRVLYGPTETTVVATATEPLQVGERSTIGAPLAGMQALVLDARMQPVPVGVAGELYLAGPALARGYLNRSGVTASRFVAHPFGRPGQRIYRTGDVVRRNRSGALEFIGRNDFQVKIHGFRVELGEIDAALGAYADVSFATTVPRRDDAVGVRLVSYVVPAPGAVVVGEKLRALLTETLPSYMVPSAVMVLDRVPLTPSGKLDRKALPAPMITTRAFRAPASPVEEIVAGVFADVLGITGGVGADDDFFELGGNSLAATRVVARIGAALDTTVPVSMIFEASTVSKLAARAESHTDTGRIALVAQDRPEHIPLSYAQQRMWFLNQIEPDSSAYSIPIVMRLSGELDPDALQLAIDDVVTRHEVLRTVYPYVAGEPSQLVLPAATARVVMSVSKVSESELFREVSELMRMPFDVTAEVPMRVRLYGLGGGEWVLAVVLHHICGDGSSLTPLARDMMTAYVARAEGNTPGWVPPAVQYADYAIWQRAVLGSADDPESTLRAQIDYWTGQLADVPALIELPADRPRPATQSFAGAGVPLAVGADLHAALQVIAREHNATLFMVFHAALVALLARLAVTDDVAIGTPYAGRGERELDDLIGMFVNTLVLRTQIRDGMSFGELIEDARDTDLAAFGHADVPFERLVQELNPVRSDAYNPLFQVMLAFQNVSTTAIELPALSVEAVESDTGMSMFDMQVTVSDSYDDTGAPAGIAGEITFATDLFDAATVTTFAERLLRVLTALSADPGRSIHDVDLLDPTEREAALVRWNATDHAVDPAETLASLFAGAAARFADGPAVTAGDLTLTYAEFAGRVNRLARWLVSRGVGPDALVAIRMRRSLDQITAMYAVHAAGGGYIPIDPDHPADRIGHMLGCADPVVVLTTLDGIELSGFDDSPLTDDDRVTAADPDALAYLLFTSGSTGRPKGVAISHRSAVNQVRWISDEYALTGTDVVLQKTPSTFDVSVWEIFGTLAAGARLVVARPDGHTDPDYLAEVIDTERVTLTSFVPSMLAVFADALAPEAATVDPGASGRSLDSLRALLVAGEAFGPDVVAAAHRALPAVELHNLYGPTEFTVHATSHQVGADDHGAVPMGTPVWNSRAYVLDSRLCPVPPGVTGDLYLSGTQVARGYFGRTGLTAERFVADPFVAGERMYRTGDLVRRRSTGELEYLGRSDFQVKLRGLRIELGEIEAVFAEHESVARAVATVTATERVEYLVVYLVPAAGATVDTAEVSAFASTALPGYMMPTAVMVLDTVPLTASGKLDRARLPKTARRTDEFRAPATELEGEIARTFEDVLGVARVGADDDFYALGGNSLTSVRVVNSLKNELHVEIPIRWMLSDSSPADLARRIEAGIRNGGTVFETGDGGAADGAGSGLGLEVLLPIRTGGDKPPLFCVHPASGLAWCYQTLGRQIPDDRPVYGLQAPQIGGEDPGPTSVPAIARRYFDEIRTVQPHGPYHLLGWSLGGVIAHAVAAEMRAAGEEVAMLAMLDAEADAIDTSEIVEITAGELISNLGPVLGIDFVSSDATAEQAAAQITEHLGEGFGVDAATIQRLTDAYNLLLRATGDWELPVVDVDLQFFTAVRDRRPDALGHPGWQPFVGGVISNVDVDCDHLSMTENEAIITIAEILERRMGAEQPR
ncbi:amino acid adenylation domain-containing protein [Gordonia desulfuricans]|uniref:Amino acid adenylation domain-containing protein n=1 Tax=Gordonia desulfuricans TaxID=89051 RepID=A0A7K3LJM4_9ACTN|nr:non-ribosomal peptide synthetase [Gordonia desulfuricans]NDK88465.1 amino acid adenylation domain-containing protein [Gordonia desulfuricans]